MEENIGFKCIRCGKVLGSSIGLKLHIRFAHRKSREKENEMMVKRLLYQSPMTYEELLDKSGLNKEELDTILEKLTIRGHLVKRISVEGTVFLDLSKTMRRYIRRMEG